MSEVLILVRAYRGYLGGGAGGLLLVALLFGGCQGSDLEGKIANKAGEPVGWGTVTAVGPDNRVYTAPIQPDGTYKISGLPRGTPVRLTVSSPNPVPILPAPPPAAGGPAGGAKAKSPPKADGKQSYGVGGGAFPQPNVPPPRNIPARWFPIDGKYANPTTSGLSGTPGGVRQDITVD